MYQSGLQKFRGCIAYKDQTLSRFNTASKYLTIQIQFHVVIEIYQVTIEIPKNLVKITSTTLTMNSPSNSMRGKG